MAINLHVLIMQFICSPPPLHSSRARNWWKHSSVLFSVPIAFTSSVSRGDAHIPTHKYAHSSPPSPSVQSHPLMTLTKTLNGQYLPQRPFSCPHHTYPLSDGDGHHPLTNQSALIWPPFSRPSSRGLQIVYLWIRRINIRAIVPWQSLQVTKGK